MATRGLRWVLRPLTELSSVATKRRIAVRSCLDGWISPLRLSRREQLGKWSIYRPSVGIPCSQRFQQKLLLNTNRRGCSLQCSQPIDGFRNCGRLGSGSFPSPTSKGNIGRRLKLWYIQEKKGD